MSRDLALSMAHVHSRSQAMIGWFVGTYLLRRPQITSRGSGRGPGKAHLSFCASVRLGIISRGLLLLNIIGHRLILSRVQGDIGQFACGSPVASLRHELDVTQPPEDFRSTGPVAVSLADALTIHPASHLWWSDLKSGCCPSLVSVVGTSRTLVPQTYCCEVSSRAIQQQCEEPCLATRLSCTG